MILAILLDQCLGEHETLIGLRTDSFVAIGSDGAFSRSLTIMKQQQRKVHAMGLASDKMIGVCGDFADCLRLTEAMDLDVKRQEIGGRNLGGGRRVAITARALAQKTRKEIVGNRYKVSAIVAGIRGESDGEAQPAMYWLDSYGALQEMQVCVHGTASGLLLSMLDKKYRSDLSQQEAIRLLSECFEQLRGRFLVNTPTFQVHVLDKTGCREIPDAEVRRAATASVAE